MSLVLSLAAALAVPPVVHAEPRITAKAAIVVDAATGDAIWVRNPDLALPPASTTKVLTAILAIESGRLRDSFGVSEEASSTAPSKIGLRPGHRMVLHDLLYALLLKSANDAAAVVAEGLAGSEAAFAARMNARARQLGAINSHFVNPHGLTAPGHVSTARDLSILFRHGLRLPTFRDVLETPSAVVSVDAARPYTVALRSHNRLLTGYGYPVVGKTGYTRPAKRCFVGAARGPNREVVIALLGSTDLWGDARRLIEFGLGDAPAEPPVQMAREGGSLRPAPDDDRPVLTNPEGDEEESPERARASAGRHRFAVQLGPYRSRRDAAATRTKLARRGLHASVVGQSLRLGNFSNRTRADRVARRLRLSGYRPTIVVLN